MKTTPLASALSIANQMLESFGMDAISPDEAKEIATLPKGRAMFYTPPRYLSAITGAKTVQVVRRGVKNWEVRIAQ